MWPFQGEYDFDWRIGRSHNFFKCILVFIVCHCPTKHQAASATSVNSYLNRAKPGIGRKDWSDIFSVDSRRMEVTKLLKRWRVTEFEEADHHNDRDKNESSSREHFSH